MDAKKTGELIRTMRREKNMTQQELADIIHVSAPAVSKYENGKGFPDISLLEPMSEALGITVSELLNGEREEIPGKQEKIVRDVIRRSAIQKESGRKKVRRRIITAICIFSVILLYAAAVYRPVKLTSVCVRETQAEYKLTSSRIAFTYYVSDSRTVRRKTIHGFHNLPKEALNYVVLYVLEKGLHFETSSDAGLFIPLLTGRDTSDGQKVILMNWTEEIVLNNQEQIIGIDREHSLTYPLENYLESKDFQYIVSARYYGWHEHNPDYE